MSKNLRWTPSSANDLAGIVEDIASDSPPAADRLEAKILRRIELLKDLPYLGSLSPFSRNVRFLGQTDSAHAKDRCEHASIKRAYKGDAVAQIGPVAANDGIE